MGVETELPLMMRVILRAGTIDLFRAVGVRVCVSLTYSAHPASQSTRTQRRQNYIVDVEVDPIRYASVTTMRRQNVAFSRMGDGPGRRTEANGTRAAQ